MKVLFTFLCLVSIFSFKHANAQESGYLITLSNDTINCSIFKNLKGEYTWKTPADRNWRDFTGAKEYHLNQSNVTYRLKTLPDTNRILFLKVVEKGTVSLYEYFVIKSSFNGRGFRTIRWYASKNDNQRVEEVKSNEPDNQFNFGDYKQTLYTLMADKPKVLAVLKRKDYNFNEIKAAVYLYNNGHPMPEGTEANEY